MKKLPTITPLLHRAWSGLLALTCASAALAGTSTWTGNTDANWSTAGNWTPGVPAAGDSLVFGASLQLAPNNDLTPAPSIGGITFTAASGLYTLIGNPIQLTGNLLNQAPWSQSVALPVELSGAITVDSGTVELILGGAVSGSGSLTKIGGGTLILSNKTYSGGTTVSNGLLIVNNDNGGYLMAGGALKLNWQSYWCGATVTFTNDSPVGTDDGRFDFAGAIGSPGYVWTKIGTGTMNMVHWSADPLAVVKASAIRVGEGTLGSVVNGGNIVQWGGTNVPIVVSNGAALSLNDGNYAPNYSVTLEGGAGTGRGTILSQRAGNSGVLGSTNTFGGAITFNSDTTIGTFGGVLVLASNVTGTGSVTKIGALDTYSQNKLVLGGSNYWTGSFTISTGVVQLASSYALPACDVSLAADGTLDLGGNNATVNGITDDAAGTTGLDNSSANPATLTFGGNNQSVFFSGPVRNSGGGPLSLVKIGSGAASLSGPSSHTGSNVVMGGSLAIKIPTPTTANGLVYMADNTSLSLTKTVGNASIKATWLTLGTAGPTTVDIDLGSFGSPSLPIINATNGTGIMSVGGVVTVNIAGNPNVMSVGQFPLFSYTTRAGAGSFVMGSVPAQIVATLVTNASGKSIDLKVTSAPVTKWVGNLNNLWDIATTMNWTILGTAATYQDGAGVEFDDTAIRTEVDITTFMNPGGILVNNSTKDYVFGGLGGLYSGDLIKNGTGKLTLTNGANGYNNTTISGGTVQVGAGGPTGSLGLGSVQNDGTLVFDLSEPASLANILAGTGPLIKNNTNTLNLGGPNTHSGGTTINGGTVYLTSATSLGLPSTGTPLAVVAPGAALDIGGKLITQTNAVRIAGPGAGGIAALYNSAAGTCVGCGDIGINNIYLTGDTVIGGPAGSDWVVGSTGLGISGNGFAVTKTGGNTLFIRAATTPAPSSFTVGEGGILIENGNPFGTGTPVVITNNASLDSWGNNSGFATYTINNPILITNGGGRIMNTRGHWWNIPDADYYNGPITLGATLTLNNSSVKDGRLGVLAVNGPISGSGGILKIGAYPVTLAGLNTYSGTTVVSNGTLNASTRQQGGGGFEVMDGAELNLPGQSGFTSVPMAALTMGSSTGAVLSLNRLASLSTTQPFILATNLTLVGVNTLVPPAVAYATPGQYPLIKYTGAIAGGGSLALPVVRGMQATIVTNVANSSLDLVIAPGDGVTWVGNVNPNWDIATSLNWLFNSAATDYQQVSVPGDAVTFNDSSAVTNVAITTPVSPAVLTVNNTANTYTFTGTNITGPTALVKNGGGMLILSNLNNNFTGGAVVNGGTVRLGNDAALSSAAGAQVLVQNGGTVDLFGQNPQNVNFTISGAGVGGNGALIASANGAYNKSPGAITLAGDATIGGASRWDLRNGLNQLNSPSTSYTLTKVGAGQVTLVNTAVSPTLGDITVLGGVFGYEQNTAGLGDPTRTLTLGSGATLNFWKLAVPFNKQIVCSNTATIKAEASDNSSQNIIVGPVTLAGGTVNFKGNWNNWMTFSNSISGPGGIWVEWNSDVIFAGNNSFQGDLETQGRLRLYGNSSITSTNNVTVNNGGSGVLTVQNNASVGGQSLRVWSGPASGALIVKDNGAINSVNVQIGNAFADFSGRVDGTFTLQSGQALRVDDGARVKGNVVVPADATFTPGGGYYIQSTAVLSNSLTLQGGSLTVMDLSKNGGIITNDAVAVVGTATYGGTLQLRNTGTNYLAVGDVFTLFTAGTHSGAFTNVLSDTPGQNVTWNLNTPAPGQVQVATVQMTASPTLSMSFGAGGSTLDLTWSAAYLGWRLEVQTNALTTGLSNNWAAWPNSTNLTGVSVPIDPAVPSTFFRLVYP